MGEPAANSPPPMDNWIIDIVKELKETSPISSRGSICRVPRRLRSDAYTPHLVSIGPIHHKDQKLLAMEDYKRRYLRSLFKLTQEPHDPIMLKVLEDCCKTIRGLDKRVRACYAESIRYDKNKLAKMLLHDAGFLLELFFRYYQRDRRILQNDPIFTNSWMILKLQRDLVLLENQIPFFVLESSFNHIKPHAAADIPPLKQLALQFFELNISEETFLAKCREEGNHLLHLLYNCFLPSNLVDSRSEGRGEIIHCATLLHQAGVEFQKNPTPNDLFDFEFHNNGTFKIPQLVIGDYTESLFRNLVAFEQSVPDSKDYITSYIILMDRLIDTTKDVHLLQQKGIIENNLSVGGDVTHLFNNFSKQIVLNDFYFAELCDRVNAYSKSPWRQYLVDYKSDVYKKLEYFKIPWKTTSVSAAVTLLVLTFLQTLYSLRAYYKT